MEEGGEAGGGCRPPLGAERELTGWGVGRGWDLQAHTCTLGRLNLGNSSQSTL